MLWVSDAQGPDGKPAVMLLSVTRTSSALTAEVAYVAAELPHGRLPGRYYRGESAEPEPVTLAWPGGWPAPGPLNKLHPRKDTPEAAVIDTDDGRRLRFSTLKEHLSNEQNQREGH